MTDDERPNSRPGEPLRDRERDAELWEATADERERLVDERERLADEREALADQREAMADRHERALDRREVSAGRHGDLSDDPDGHAQRAAVQAALERAEAAMRRAEAQLRRAREAATRRDARAGLRAARRDRVQADDHTRQVDDPRERAWLAERRDFVAADREHLADLRDRIADQRDEEADRRESLADRRERDALERDRCLSALAGGGRGWPDEEDRAAQEGRRARDGHDRAAATARRQAATRQRGRAAAQWGPQAYGPLLTATFATLIQRLFATEHLPDALPHLLDFTVDAVAGCDRAGVSLYRRAEQVLHVASDAVAAELDAAQADGGPIRDALRDGGRVHVPDPDGWARWPGLAETARRLGVTCALCYPLVDHQAGDAAPVGSLHLYGSGSDAFGAHEDQAGQVLAALLGAAVGAGQRHDELDLREAALHRSLGTRDVIGQAKGILMERQRLSAGDAFDVLRRISQQLNRKVVDVAGHLARTGQLPG